MRRILQVINIRKVNRGTGRCFASVTTPADGKDLQKAFLKSVGADASAIHNKDSRNNTHVSVVQEHIPIIEKIVSKPITPPIPRIKPTAVPNDGKILEFAPKILVIGVGGGGCNAVNNTIERGLSGVRFLCANTDAQHLSTSLSETRLQLGKTATQGLGCGANPAIG